ncbi:MAG: VOC family protein [Arenicella sp.]
MKFRYTILYVADVSETVCFYEKAFGFKADLIHETGDYAQLSTGETKLAFASKGLMSSLGTTTGDSNEQSPVFEIAFETDDVEFCLNQAVNAGAGLVQEASKMDWGQTVSYVKDNNGFLVEICSPVS